MSSALRIIICIGLVGGATPAFAQATNFGQDVGTAINRGLAWLDGQGAFNNPSSAGNAAGLATLALLEKRESDDPNAAAQGYANASAADQARLDNVIAYIIGSHTNIGFYSYRDGANLMALSVYLRTGGPDQASALNSINTIFDRTAAAQGAHGYWCYNNGGCMDSSTTQLVMAGLASAKAVFTDNGDAARLATLNAAVLLTGDAYAANGAVDPLSASERGHGYNVGWENSLPQTASGMWGQIIGGRDLNDASVQAYLEWLRNRYNYQSTAAAGGGFGGISYFYYMWSSSKGFTFLEDSGVAPNPGNLGVDDIGMLPAGDAPAWAQRLEHLDPTTVARVPSFGADGPGYYNDPGEPARWYFDYAYTLLGMQNGGTGQFAGQSWNAHAAQSYALLVLERSVGGGCADTDGDGVCDTDDNCVNTPNPGQFDVDVDGVGDLCDGCPNDGNKTDPGVCGCGTADDDSDGDNVLDCNDGCPQDGNKTDPGICGCGNPDAGDADGDNVLDCVDGCPQDGNKTEPGICGCGVADDDSDGDGTADCDDLCPADGNKTDPGVCGCGTADDDSDGDGTADCNDLCPADGNKTDPGICGCGTADDDSDGDGTADCDDPCPDDPNDQCNEPPGDDCAEGQGDCGGPNWPWPHEVSVAEAYNRLYSTAFDQSGECGLDNLRGVHGIPMQAIFNSQMVAQVELLAFDTSGTQPLNLIVIVGPGQTQTIELYDPGPWTPDSRGWLAGAANRIDLAQLLIDNGLDPLAPFQFAVGNHPLNGASAVRIAGKEPGESLIGYNGGGIGGGDRDLNEPVFLAIGPEHMRLQDCPPDYNVIIGTDGDDILRGTRRSDCIYGLGGDDIIRGRHEDDLLFGGRGDDDLRGGSGDDGLWGGSGHDWLRGHRGDDDLWGGCGDDHLRGGLGWDALLGGDGDDDLRGGRGMDELYGECGNDGLRGGRHEDILDGGHGDDDLRGGKHNDELDGGDGFDELRGNRGIDACINGEVVHSCE